MNVKDIQLLYEYNRWANAQVLDAVSQPTEEQFTKDLSSSHRSVRDTLRHIMLGEWIWLMRWKGLSPQAVPKSVDLPSLISLKVKWAAVERDQMDFIGKVTDESLETVIAYVHAPGETWKYPLWEMLQHVVNHSSYHRGQVATLLRQLGAAPAPTDLLVFFDMKAAQGR